MHRPWSYREVIIVIAVQLAGLAAAFICSWTAMFALPAEGLFGEPNPVATRVVGAFASVGAGLGMGAGCGAVYHLRRSPLALGAGVASMVAVAVVAVGWAFQLDLG